MNGRSKALDDLIACLSGDVRDAHDWRTVAALASETLTVGSLADAVLSSPIAGRIPEEVRDLLLDVQSRARARNVRLKSQLLELTPALNSLGVEPILMRGVARLLSSPREESRLLSDIDLLVPGDRIKNCTNALRELGYELFRDPEDDRVPTVFYRTIDVGMVDLHAQLQPVYLRLDYDRLASECRSIELPSGRALMPSPTCQMLCTIVHDQLHDGDYWRGLLDVRHFVDMHRIAGEGVDWRKLASFFPAGSPRNALFVQLRSALTDANRRSWRIFRRRLVCRAAVEEAHSDAPRVPAAAAHSPHNCLGPAAALDPASRPDGDGARDGATQVRSLFSTCKRRQASLEVIGCVCAWPGISAFEP